MLGVFQTLLRRVHSLPEDVRKLLAGVLIVGAALGFFGMWGSFMSSRLVALGPPPASLPEQKIPIPSATVRLESKGGLPSPAQGLARTFSGLDELVPHQRLGDSGGRGFWAAIGNAVAGGIEFLYQKLSRYVPPNL